MHVLGISGSMRANRYTYTLVERVIGGMKSIDSGVEAEIINIIDRNINPCRVLCSAHCSGKPYQCSISDDCAAILHRMMQADALVIGAPLYFRAPPSKFHMLIERLIALFFNLETLGDGSIESPLKNKPCGLIGVAEYSNPHQMLEYLHDFSLLLRMKPVTIDRFPYLGVAGQGDIYNDRIFHPFDRSKDLAAAIMRQAGKI
ncbi:MAG: flavodoxin family protein [Candidatus Xenobiia bacterium LiM19]